MRFAVWTGANRSVPRIKAVVKVTYCDHTLQAEAEVDRQGQWVGRGIVVGRAVEGILPLTVPLPTPTAALDAILAAGRRWIDDQRSAERAAPRLLQVEGESP
jgi:hypothetical protein